MTLWGTTALITDGSSGIGFATARLLQGNAPCIAISTRGDATTAADLAVLHGRPKEAFGTPVGATDNRMYDRPMNVGMKGVFFSLQAVLPLIPEGGSAVLPS